MPRKPAGHVHGAQGMDEAGVLGGGIDPPGALQLINVPQALDPWRIDQILFRLLPVRVPKGTVKETYSWIGSAIRAEPS